MLCLFDIDGTLVRSRPGANAHWEVMLGAIGSWLGRPVERSDVGGVQTAGMTDRGIVHDAVLALTGTPPHSEAVDTILAEAAAAYPEALARIGGPAVLEGAGVAGDRVRAAGGRVALVTGNVESIAREKLASVGLSSYYAEGRGGFGGDDHRRERLVAAAIAREQASGWRGASSDAVVIGDTPRDIACAHANGAWAIAVATGPFRAEHLTAADVVAEHLDAAIEAVLAGRGPRKGV